MEPEEIEITLSKAREALKSGDTIVALECFQQLISVQRTPEVCSALAYCLAKEKGEYKEAISLANEAVRKDPKESRHFLLLGQIYVMAGRKKEAHRVFQLGLRHGPSAKLEGELRRLGLRKDPVFPFLRRDNPLNKLAGKLLSRFRLR